MLEWVDDVLVPYVATAPPGIVPILFLDSFKVHMLRSIVSKIQALGVEVEFIPPGCTGLIQPMDVGYNKAFKSILTGCCSKILMRQLRKRRAAMLSSGSSQPSATSRLR